MRCLYQRRKRTRLRKGLSYRRRAPYLSQRLREPHPGAAHVIFHATLSYRQLRYLWIGFALVACAAAIFVTQSASTVARGDTWQGYTLGTIAALLMVWLALLGIRKRS